MATPHPHSYQPYPPHPLYLPLPLPQFHPYSYQSQWLPPPSHPQLEPQNPTPTPIWAVWSRRPSDPLHAPPIIISPHAHPPNDIVLHALQLQTPPPTPPPPLPPPLPLPLLPPSSSSLDDDDNNNNGEAPNHESTLDPIPEADPTPQPQPQLDAVEPQLDMAAPSSSSATSVVENLTDTSDACVSTVPGSPLSSNTSVSLSLVQPGKTVEGEDEATRSTYDTTSTIAPVPAPAPVPVPIAVSVSVSVSVSAPDAPTAPAPAPPPPKKLWAALFQSPGPPSGGRSGLPTSNVVGISIPGTSSSSYHNKNNNNNNNNSDPSASSSTSKKNRLAALLSSSSSSFSAHHNTHNNTTSTTTTTTTIRPRGLINSGNMCFANAVLQMLVYTLPFQRFFVELGKIRGRAVDKEKGGREGKEDSRTPLVDAMVGFVREFVMLEEEKEDVVVVAAAAAPSSFSSASASSSSSSSSSSGVRAMNGNGNGNSQKVRGKGKEKEKEMNDGLFYDGGGGQEEGGEESFVPTSVYEAMKEKKRFDTMRGGQQEDAEEFFGFLLESLEEELVVLKEEVVGRPLLSSEESAVSAAPERVSAAVAAPQQEEQEEERGWQEVGKRNRTVVTRTIKSTETPISKIFGGKFRTTLKVPYAKKDSVIVEDWRLVRVDIQSDHIRTVQDALCYISHPQPVQVTHPARPGVTLEGQQQIHMEALPPILVIHMKRFCYDTAVGGVVKVGKQVQFGPELDVGSEMMSPALRKPGLGPAGVKCKYRLYGVLYHHGMSASGGHYTLDVMHPRKWAGAGAMEKGKGGWEGWMRIDDELVSDVRSEDVFGPAEGGWEGWEQAGSGRTAYLLFYKRVR